MTEILIVDDHPMIREIAPHLMRKAFGEVQVYTAGDVDIGLECARLCDELALVLLDLNLPGCTGIDALLKFRREHPHAKIVVFSATEDPQAIRAVLHAGAAGFIPKTSPPDLMVAALKVVEAGGKYVPGEILAAEPAA